MANKQTAVEWLVEEMLYRLNIRIENTIDGVELLKEAKAMEKEQQVQFYIKGCDDTYGCDEPNLNPDYDRKQAEQYYEETYATQLP